MINSIELSIVVPVYNSSQIIPELVSRIESTLSSASLAYELILTDDFSPDDSWKIIKEICRNKEHIKGIRLEKNCGQWCSVLAGMSRASGNFIVTIDDDLEYNPEDILKLYETLIANGFKVVFGMAKQKYLLQGKSGQLAKWRNHLLNFLWNKPPTDSFRILNRNLVFKGNVFLPRMPIEAYLKHTLDKKFWGYCQISFSKRYAGSSNHSTFKKLNLLFLFSFYYLRNIHIYILAVSLIMAAILILEYRYLNNSSFVIFTGISVLLLGCSAFCLFRAYPRGRRPAPYSILEETRQAA